MAETKIRISEREQAAHVRNTLLAIDTERTQLRVEQAGQGAKDGDPVVSLGGGVQPNVPSYGERLAELDAKEERIEKAFRELMPAVRELHEGGLPG